MRRSLRWGLAAVAVGIFSFSAYLPTLAGEELTTESIAKALKGRKTRSGPTDTATTKEIEELRRVRKTRGWNLHDRTKLAEITRELPQIDIIVYFAYDSAEILPQAEPELQKLGSALAQDEFKGRSFVIAGHADGKGAPGYNRALSERRAEAVKRYLREKFHLGAEQLMTVGYGSEQLKNADDPNAEENRRVQVVNLSG